jgi:GTP cyclohydrolase I
VVAELLKTAGRDRIPDHETLIRFPKRLMHMFPELTSGR